MCCVESHQSLRRLCFFSAKPSDFLSDALVKARLELGSVSEEEQNLHPDEQRRQQESLNEIVKQGRRSVLEGAMADELRNP